MYATGVRAVFLSAYSKASPIKEQTDYQGYLQYYIRNIPAYHRFLIQEGYLGEASFEERLRALTVTELKQFLADLHLPKRGKKEVLIGRILGHDPEGILIRERYPEQTYAITEKGRVFLRENSAYVRLHKHGSWDISWEEYDAKHHPDECFTDTVCSILNSRIRADEMCGRNEHYCLYELFLEEGNRKRALEMLLRVLFLDVCGMFHIYDVKCFQEGNISRKELKETMLNSICFAPGIVYPIHYLSDVYSDDMIPPLFCWKIPVNLCSQETFLSMTHAIMEDTFDADVFTRKLQADYIAAIDRA